MYKSMYDILNKTIDYENEYKKLWEMIFHERYYFYNGKSYTFIGLFNRFIVSWRYKGTKCNSQEVLEELEINDKPKENIQEEVLKLCDFIVNIREFLLYEKNDIEYHIGLGIKQDEYYITEEEMGEPIYMKDKMLIDLVNELINSLNYEVIKEKDYKCFIVKKNVDAEETAKIVEDNDISNQILQYNDYSIVEDREAKKAILKSLADYFEGHRKEIKDSNPDLENDISFALNNFDIRHNNITGCNANSFMKNISEKEIIQLYDKTYFLILIAFRLIEVKDFKKEIEDIRKNKFKK